MRSPVQTGTCLNGRLQSHFQLRASRPRSLQPHEHALAHQGCSDPQHYHVCAGMCPQQQPGTLCWSPRASSAPHRQKHTPRNMTHLQTSEEVISLDNRYRPQKGHLLDPHNTSNPRCCYLDYAKAFACHQKSQP